MKKEWVPYLICHNCGTSIPRELIYRTCSNCYVCSGCEIYICPGCASELIVKPRKTSA